MLAALGLIDSARASGATANTRKGTEFRQWPDRVHGAMPAREIGKGGVATEQFVAAETRQRDLKAQLVRCLADEPSVEPVDGGGLIHRGEEPRQVVFQLGLPNVADVMLDAVLLGCGGRERCFVGRAAAQFVEGQGHTR